MRRIGLFLLTSSVLMLSSVPAYAQPGGDLVVSGTLRNGSRGDAPAGAEELALIQLAGGMSILQTLKNPGPNFRFDPIPRPNVPLLLRAIYQGEAYTTMIPPAPQMQNRAQTVTVYDSGAPREQVAVQTALRVTKAGDGLQIEQLFVISNRSTPARSWSLRDYAIYIPDGAEDVQANLSHDSTRMPVPVNTEPYPEAGEHYVRLDRVARPGESQLQINYALKGVRFFDRLPRHMDETTTNSNSTEVSDPQAFRIVMWRPENAEPNVEGGTVIPENIPGLGRAFRVVYPAAGLTYDFSAGGAFFGDPMKSDVNPIFDTKAKTWAGLVAAVLLFFLLISIFAPRKQFTTETRSHSE